MTRVLFFKLLRDLRLTFIAVFALLFLFELLWSRVTYVISVKLFELPDFRGMFPLIEKAIFDGPGKIVQSLMGGDQIDIRRAIDMASIGFVHPVIQTILCIWAVGRASGAIAGEIDRGTMELLLAQPVPRNRILLAHFLVDLVTIPLLCLAMWLGSFTGLNLMGLVDNADPKMHVDPARFLPALLSIGFLVYSLSGITLWVSSLSRFRYQALGLAVFGTLLMFLVNLLGQLWEPIGVFRPLTVFYYFNAQPMILDPEWYSHVSVWLRLGVLAVLGTVGYGLALWTFTRRDIPAPL